MTPKNNWDSEQWVIDRLVEAVDEGDSETKLKCGERLLKGYEEDDWRRWRESESAPFLALEDLVPDSSRFGVAKMLEDEGPSSERLEELENGAAMIAAEAATWEDRVVTCSFDEENGSYWAVLELAHSDHRRQAHMAVTNWTGEYGRFVAAYSSHTEALNALKEVGFTGPRDYQTRRAERAPSQQHRPSSPL